MPRFKPSRVGLSLVPLLVESQGLILEACNLLISQIFKTGRTGSTRLLMAPGSTPWEPSRFGDVLPVAHCLVT